MLFFKQHVGPPKNKCLLLEAGVLLHGFSEKHPDHKTGRQKNHFNSIESFKYEESVCCLPSCPPSPLPRRAKS